MNNLKNIPILHINTADTWRGGERQTFYLASHLNKKGYLSYCVCQKDSPLHERLSENNLPHFPIRMKAGIDIIAVKKIARILEEVNAKILHMHTAHSHSLGYLSNFFYMVPINIISRRVDFKIKKNPFSRIKYNYPEKYIAVSSAIKDILINDGIPSEKVTVIHSGIDLNIYKNISCAYLSSEFGSINNIKKKIKLVNVAALTNQKDHETLIKAMAIVLKQFKNFILLIAGDGELKKRLLLQCKYLKLEDNIILTGFRDDALNLIKFADIFIMSSRWEGLGTSIIDAMAMKKPVIAPETGGIPELIRDGKNGLLVPKEDPYALADAVIKLMQDKDLRERISSQAFKDAKNFSIEKTVDKTIEIYGELCDIYLK